MKLETDKLRYTLQCTELKHHIHDISRKVRKVYESCTTAQQYRVAEQYDRRAHLHCLELCKRLDRKYSFSVLLLCNKQQDDVISCIVCRWHDIRHIAEQTCHRLMLVPLQCEQDELSNNTF